MKRKQKDGYEDGIVLDTDLVAAQYMSPLKMKLIQLFLIILSSYGAVFSLLSGLEIETDTGIICFFMGISIIVYLLTYSYKKVGLIILTCLFGFYLYAGYVLWDRIKNGFWHLENIYINHINHYYNSTIGVYIVGKYVPSQVITLFLIFFVILLVFIICQTILGRLPIFIMLFSTLALIILPLAVGKIPNTLPFAAYIISLFGTLGLNAGLNFGKKHFLKFKKTQRGKEFLRNKTLQYGIGLKAGFMLALSVGILFVFLPFIFTPSFYVNQIKVPIIKENIQKQAMKYDGSELSQIFSQGYFSDIKLFPSAQSTGGLGKGKLGRVASVKYSNKTALEIKVTGDRDMIYLKGFAGSVYKGNAWEEFDKEIKNTYADMTGRGNNTYRPANLGSELMGIIGGEDVSSNLLNETFQMDYKIQSLSIHNVDADFKSVYIPYFSNVPPRDYYDIEHEAYVKADKKVTEYYFDFYKVNNNILNVDWEEAFFRSINSWTSQSTGTSGMDITSLQDYYQYELKNRSFAYDYYLQLPEQGMDRLKHELLGISYEDFKINFNETALTKAVAYVREFVQQDTSYSLSPGVLPEGKDFVDYFLFENQKGYCTHYASSAAIIFRILGIPARYVEGYVVKDSDFIKGKKTGSAAVQYREGITSGTTDVNIYELKIKDSNAHAWVEIYVDGFGWVPVEMTPGYSRVEEVQKAEQEEELEVNKPTIVPTKIPNKETDSKEAAAEEEKNETADQSKSGDMIKTTGVIIIILIIIFMALCSAPIIIESIIRRRRLKKAALLNNSEKAIFYYILLKRIFKYFYYDIESDDYESIGKQIERRFAKINSNAFVNYMKLIEKARFGNGILTQSELRITKDFYFKLISYIYLNKPWYLKMYFRYIKIF